MSLRLSSMTSLMVVATVLVGVITTVFIFSRNGKYPVANHTKCDSLA
jgi:hypothetical protein